MNQAQRTFLIDKIKERVAIKLKGLQSQKIEFPSKSNYLFHAILKGELQLKSQEQILEAIKKKAMSAKEGINWLSEDRMGYEKETHIKLIIEDIMIIPDNFSALKDETRTHNGKIEQQIQDLKIQSESLEMRIQLASDKTLQKIISEVDDMGDISLIDTKIKLLS